MRHFFLLLLASLCFAGPFASSAAADPGVLHVGFADDAAMVAFPQSAPIAVQAGFSYARIYMSWALAAPTRPADPRNPNDPAYDWSTVDRTLAPYAGTGLDVMAQLWQTPAWANGGQDPKWYAHDPADFGNFVYAAARRYPQIHWWLPVNEPNRSDYVQPSTIAAYEPMLQAAYAAVKQANPGALVVAGSTSRDLGDPGDPRDAWTWARTLAADGMPMDGYAVHPYPNWTQPISERGDRRLDLWDMPVLQSTVQVPVMAMEFGWSTAVVSEQQQADWLSQAIEVARCTPGLTRFTLWGFHDHPGSGTGDSEQWGKFGLLREDGTPKPALAAVETAMHAPLDCNLVGIAAGAPPTWVPAAQASTVPAVAPGPPGSWPSGPDGSQIPPPPPPGGSAGVAGASPVDGGTAGTGTTAASAARRPAIMGVRRTGRVYWALVKLPQPMAVGGRLDRVLPGHTRLARPLLARPVATGLHRVRLGVLRHATYRVTLHCRVVHGPQLVVRRLFRANPPRPR